VARGLDIAFAGTPEIAAVILGRLLDDARHTIVHIFTQPDRRAGRGRRSRPGPVKRLGESAGIPLTQPATAAELVGHPALDQADVLVVVAFGLILPEAVIDRPKYGSVNVHFSLLPRWRGAAPIQRAIEAGDPVTGISIIQMDAGLDTGDILLQRACPVDPGDTAASLQERLVALAANCLPQMLDQIGSGHVEPVPQNEIQATYAAKVSKAEAEIDWSQPATVIERQVRAFNPAPVAHTTLNGQAMRILRARVLDQDSAGQPPGQLVACTEEGLDVATTDHLLRIESLQLPGRKIISAREFYHGNPRFRKQSD
jgi:methionyl-tRNA formyltransferase